MASDLQLRQLPNGANGVSGGGGGGSPDHSNTNGNGNSFSLTEYSAMPSPPSEQPKKAKAKVPDEFLLENGHPDVSHPVCLAAPMLKPRSSICASSSPRTR